MMSQAGVNFRTIMRNARGQGNPGSSATPQYGADMDVLRRAEKPPREAIVMNRQSFSINFQFRRFES